MTTEAHEGTSEGAGNVRCLGGGMGISWVYTSVNPHQMTHFFHASAGFLCANYTIGKLFKKKKKLGEGGN